MRLRIRHQTAYSYAEPASRAIQILRLTPRGHDGQSVAAWRIEVDHDCRLAQSTDAFGNAVHAFTAEGPLDMLSIVASGEVVTDDTSGVVGGQVERFPAELFLRETPLTGPDEAIRAFAEEVRSRASGDRLALLHELTGAIRDRLKFDVDATDPRTSAAEAFALGHGVCQDFAHIFISAARHLGIPARYVGGYLYRPGTLRQEAGHGWAEALAGDIGWVGFDPANGVSPTEAYVRVAVGLDYLGAAPVRGTRYGGSGEKLEVTVRVEEADPGRRARGQSQSQGRT